MTVAEALSAGPSRRWRLEETGRTLSALVVMLAVWQLLGARAWIGGGALPSPTAIIASFWEHRADYPTHVWSTLRTAGAGFALGNAVAIALAALFVAVPAVERASRALMVVLFCLPVVVVAPILAIALPDNWPKIVLSALLVFFPTLVATTNGLRHAPTDALRVVRSAGGRGVRQLRLVRLRASLPDVLSGLQIAAPAAMLGALLGEFMGTGSGLGVYLLGSMGRADPPTLWAIGLVASALAAAAYGLIGLVRVLTDHDGSGPVEAPVTSSRATGVRRRGLLESAASSVLWTVASLAVIATAWYAFIGATGLPRMLMNSPVEVWHALVDGPTAGDLRAQMLPALGESLVGAGLGAVCGIGAAFVLAVGLSLYPAVARTVMPFAFLSQTMPIVALTPLIALLFGRGLSTVVVVTISVTFFPCLLMVLTGIRAAPAGQVAVLASVAASPWTILRLVTIPNAVPHLLASVRLAAPRALTGVLIAEQFVTGTGLGGLLGDARGHLDYRLMWAVAVVVAAVSVLVYLVAEVLERAVLRRHQG